MQQLGLVNDIPEGGSKGYTLGKHSLFAVRQYGRLYLYRNHCPHIGIALEWVPDQFLDHSGTLIQCANHGALFVIETGVCIKGPCSGAALESVQFEIKDGYIYCDIQT